MTSASAQKNLIEWKNRLTATQFPVDTKIAKRVLAQLQRPSANATNLSAILRADPALCLTLFLACQQTQRSSSANRPQTLEHVITLLGLNQVKKLVAGAPSVSSLEPDVIATYKRQLAISYHAAVQAEQWAQQISYWPATTVYWAALLHRAPLWAMALQGGENIIALDHQRGSGSADRSRDIQSLDQPLADIAFAVIQRWRLPDQSADGWRQLGWQNYRRWLNLCKGPSQPLPAALQSPSFAVALANRLAEAADWNWFHRSTKRLQQIASRALGWELSRFVSRTHQWAAQASRALGPEANPASQLLCGFDRKAALQMQISEHINSEPANMKLAKTEPTQPVKQPSIAASPSVLEAILRLREKPGSFKNLHEMMDLVIATLVQETGVERATISLYNKTRSELRTYFHRGCADDPSLRDLSFTLQATDLFHALLKKTTSLFMQENNVHQIWPKLPGQFKQACDKEQFFLMSVFRGRQAVAFIYADRGISGRPLTDRQYQLFKNLGQALNHCLTRYQRA